MTKKIILCLVLTLISSVFLFAQGMPKGVIQEVLDVGGHFPDNLIYPENGTIEFKCWITARPQYIMYGPDRDITALAEIQNNRFVIVINVGNFMCDKVKAPRDWQPGEVVRFEITHTPTGNMAIAEVPLTAGSLPIFRYGRDGYEVVLKPPAGKLFDSRPPKLDPINTTVELVEGYPNEDGIYRGVNWEVGDNWSVAFSTKKVISDLMVSSKIRRQYEEEGELSGPRRFRTYYSIDEGANWVQHPEQNYILPSEGDDWFDINYELPAVCYNLPNVMVKWELYSTGQYYDGWSEIKSVVITGEQEEIIPPAVAINPSPADKATKIAITPTLSWTYETTEGHNDPDGFTVRFSDNSAITNPRTFHIEGGAGTYTIEELGDALKYETIYYWQVIPFNDGGNASSCPVWSFTTEINFPAPTDLVATVEGTTILLEWNDIIAPVRDHSDDYQTNELNKTRPVGDFVGFNVYRDQRKLTNTPIERNYYLDSQLEPYTAYTYYVTAVYENGESQPSNIVEITYVNISEELNIPAVTQLKRNYPNPFNPTTVISFGLAEAGTVSIEVFNTRGQKVKTLIDGHLNAGNHRVEWNGKDDLNKSVGSGIYYYRMQNGSYTSTKKMILMK